MKTNEAKLRYLQAAALVLILTMTVAVGNSTLEVTETFPSFGAIALFSSGFETGNLSQVGTEITSPANITVTKEKPRSGNYSAKFYSAVGGPSGRARIEATGVGVRDVAYMRAYFLIQDWGGGYIEPMRFHRSSYGYVAQLDFSPSYLRLLLGDNELGGIYHVATSDLLFDLNAWYCLEMAMKISDTDGWARVWLDGSEVTELAYDGDTKQVPDGINRFIIGIVLNNQGATDTWMYADDFVVAENYIGIGP